MINRTKLNELGFTILIGLYAIACMISTFSLRTQSATVPRALCIIIIVLVLYDIKQQFFSFKNKTSLQELPESKNEGLSGRTGVLLWLALTIVTTYLLGMRITFFLSSAMYLVIFAKKNIKKALILSVGFDIFVYVVFVKFANFSLYPGILFY